MKNQILKEMTYNLQNRLDEIYCKIANKCHVLECNHHTYTKYDVRRMSERSLKKEYPNFIKEKAGKLIVIDTDNQQLLYPSKESPKRGGYALLYDTRNDTVRIATVEARGFASMPGIYDQGETFYHEELCSLK